METRVQKWGNSLALRIPKSFAAETHLEQGTPVDLSLLDGQLIVFPIVPNRVPLEHLLALVTEDSCTGYGAHIHPLAARPGED